MEHERQSNGLPTLIEHWGTLLAALAIVICAQVVLFFLNLEGLAWIYFFAGGLALLISGAALIAYAKIPTYRRGQFFTFGAKSVPERLVGCYHWGWRLFLFGVVTALGLLLSKPCAH